MKYLHFKKQTHKYRLNERTGRQANETKISDYLSKKQKNLKRILK